MKDVFYTPYRSWFGGSVDKQALVEPVPSLYLIYVVLLRKAQKKGAYAPKISLFTYGFNP